VTGKPSTADSVRASVIRRPTGAAAATRAADTFQGGGDAERLAAPFAAHETVRTTMHLPAAVRSGLKRQALDRDTTMSDLIRMAVSSGMQNPAGLAGASMKHRRVGGGARTTLDLSRDMHRSLKRLAVDQDTSVQALVLTAVLQAYPKLG
jgi:hypothetical protein